MIRDNVMIILLKYYNLPIAFQWIKQEVAANEGKFDHLVIASHDGLIGAKYGETREMIVEGTKGDNALMDMWDDIRAFFARYDVLWVQGHEHMYQRSVVQAPIWVDPSSWTTADGNYRLPQYTQIMSGNASYKGYEFRYGERELVQRIVQQKMNTRSNGSPAYDANASVLTFQGDRVDYESWFVEHTIGSNEDGVKELADPQWKLMDRFTRTKNRCERLVYPNSIPEGTRPVMYLDASYISNDCSGDDGSVARMVAGTNNTFNRVESRTRDMGITPGFSRAETVTDLMRLGYQFLFQYHQPWDLATAVADAYALTFDAPQGSDVESLNLGVRTADGWQPLASADCLVEGPFDGGYLSTPPPRPDACADQPLVGVDPDHGRRFWTVLQQDAELALLRR